MPRSQVNKGGSIVNNSELISQFFDKKEGISAGDAFEAAMTEGRTEEA